MCEAIYEIMKQDFLKAETKGVYRILTELVKKKRITVSEAAIEAGVSESEFFALADLAMKV